MSSIDLLLTNAKIYTGVPANPWAEALGARAGRIVAVGSRAEIEPQAGQGTERLDAGGRTVLPGFIDAHVHLLFAYQLGSWIDLTDHPTLAEVQGRVREYSHAHPEETVIRGYGFDYQALADSGLPTFRDLDEAEGVRPVLLESWDGHTGWSNGKLLELAQRRFRSLGHEVGDPEKDPRTGQFTGIFRVSFDLDLPELKSRRSVESLRRMLNNAARLGITTAFDVQVPLEDLAAYEGLQSRGELPIHVRVALYHPQGTPSSTYEEFRRASERCNGPRLRGGAVKLYIDGVQETHTAFLLEPYSDAPSSHGETVYPVSEYRGIVTAFDRAGFQVLTHACGDAGVRTALDAYESLGPDRSGSPRRHRIEHCENVSPEDMGRFARLGVIPCMMPHHASPDLTRRWRQSMGDPRWESGFPWKDLLRQGASLAFASDWPVADLNPFTHLHSAVTRADLSGRPSPHRLSVREAIDAYTLGAAFATGCETDRGSLAEGKLCDLIALSEDPFGTEPEHLGGIRVVTTVVEGRVVYQDMTGVAVPDPPDTP